MQGSIVLNVRCKIKSKEILDLFIDVKDTGIGIQSSQQRLIFEPFRQQSGQSTRTYGGTGLGLAISKRMLEAMDGRISVSSNLDIGSIFKVYLTNVVYENEWSEEVLADEIELKFEPAKILIVDDSDDHMKLLKQYLKQDSFTLYEAVNGQDALVKVPLVKPNLIFMDIQMPVMNGYKAAKLIKEESRFKDIPIIALSSFSDVEKQNKILEVCSEYLQKPISKNKILETLAKYIPAQRVVKLESTIQQNEIPFDNMTFKTNLINLELNGSLKAFQSEFSDTIANLYKELELNTSLNNF